MGVLDESSNKQRARRVLDRLAAAPRGTWSPFAAIQRRTGIAPCELEATLCALIASGRVEQIDRPARYRQADQSGEE